MVTNVFWGETTKNAFTGDTMHIQEFVSEVQSCCCIDAHFCVQLCAPKRRKPKVWVMVHKSFCAVCCNSSRLFSFLTVLYHTHVYTRTLAHTYIESALCSIARFVICTFHFLLRCCSDILHGTRKESIEHSNPTISSWGNFYRKRVTYCLFLVA